MWSQTLGCGLWPLVPLPSSDPPTVEPGSPARCVFHSYSQRVDCPEPLFWAWSLLRSWKLSDELASSTPCPPHRLVGADTKHILTLTRAQGAVGTCGLRSWWLNVRTLQTPPPPLCRHHTYSARCCSKCFTSICVFIDHTGRHC